MILRGVSVILLLAVLALAGCGDDAEPAAALDGELRYLKSGGFAGEIDELVVRPDGGAVLKSRSGGNKTFTLTAGELAALREQAGHVMSQRSVSRPRAPDAFTHTVIYDGATLEVDDPSLSKSGHGELIGQLEQIIRARGG